MGNGDKLLKKSVIRDFYVSADKTVRKGKNKQTPRGHDQQDTKAKSDVSLISAHFSCLLLDHFASLALGEVLQ